MAAFKAAIFQLAIRPAMKTRPLSLIVPFLFIVVYASPAYTQTILPLQHIGVENGLSQSTVYNILQDRQGFMWFATGDGINRYDGRDFIPYKTRFNDSLSAYPKDRNINSRLIEDQSNKIWLTSDAGLSYIDTRHRRSRLLYNNYKIGNGMLISLTGDTLWAGIHSKGLFAMDIHTFGYREYPFTGAEKMADGDNSIILKAIRYGGGIWILDRKGLLFFNTNTHTFERKIANTDLAALLVLPNGNLLIAALNGLYNYDVTTGRLQFTPVKFREMSMQWNNIVYDSLSGNIYLSARQGGAICKLNLASSQQDFLEFQSSNVNALYIDRSRNLWMGTDGAGVYKLDIKSSKFSCYPANVSSKNANDEALMVKSIYCDALGRFWIGSYYSGLLVYNPATRQLQKIQIPHFDGGYQPVSNITRDSSGDMLITTGNHILWLDPLSFKVRKQFKLDIDRDYAIGGLVVYAIVEWKKGHYLAGTNNGLLSFAGQKGMIRSYWPYQFSHTRYISSWIYNLQQAKDGSIYLAERSGFGKIRMLGDTALKVLDGGFENVPVRSYYKSSGTPVLWMASELGLIAYNEATKKFKVFDEASGMTNSYVYSILAENDSSLWISTNGGLANVKVQYSNDEIAAAKFTNYTAKDGLQSDEFNTGAYYKCDNGVLVFGGINGINWFDPATIKPNPYKALPAIASIEINDTLYAADTANFIRLLSMPYDRNTISFSFRALEYTNAPQNRYAYKLEGLDNDWVYTTNDKVRYSNLPPGKYKFLLKVSNNEAIWNDTPLELALVILPPFWQTWWFRILLVIVTTAIIYLLVRYYIQQKIRTKTLELEKQQALYLERLRISKEVHDDLGSGLSKITLMAELAGKQGEGNDKLNDTIDDISQISRDLVGNMRDLIWVLNPENTTLDNLVAHLREYCSDYFEGMPQELMLDFTDFIPMSPMSREAQRNIFLTVKEALNNCVKHSGATRIKVSLDLHDDHIRIEVSDNGKGFDTDMIKRGNGLKNMLQRIEAIGGTFSISSAEAETKATISVPLEKIRVSKIPL